MANLLFICSRNQWRSPTAEKVFSGRPGIAVRSAGTSPRARRRVTMPDLRWADIVFVMEKKQRQQLLARFRQYARTRNIVVLNIPDDYQPMDPELVALLEERVTPHLISLTAPG